MSTYWPWWAGAVGLALVTITYTLLTDRSLGVSSAWDRVLHWRSERRIERMDEEFADDQALADALAAATAEHFGTRPGSGSGVTTSPPVAYGKPQPLASDNGPTPSESPSAASLRPVPLVTQAALLVSIFLGGLIAAVTSGRFQLRFDMGPDFKDLVTANSAAMVGLLFLGGVMVGFGTRLAGGCSSGHGLSGCGRLRPVSIVATAVFFGTAVAVSFLLWKVI